MQYVIKDNQTIIDVAVIVYGSPDYALKLVEDNPSLLDITNETIAGITVDYDASIKPELNALTIFGNQIIAPIDNNYLIKQGQSIFDLAISYGYGLDKIIEFLNLAGFSNLNEINIGNTTINVTRNNETTANNLTLQNKQLATNIADLDFWILRTGYWDDSGVWIDTDFWID